MGATPLEKELMQYWLGLTVVQQKMILRMIKSMIHPELGVSVAQYNQEIDEAIARTEAGQFYTQEEVKREAEHR